MNLFANCVGGGWKETDFFSVFFSFEFDAYKNLLNCYRQNYGENLFIYEMIH